MEHLIYFFIIILNIICSGSGSSNVPSLFCAVLTKDGSDWLDKDYFIQANSSYSISAVCKCSYKSPSWRGSSVQNQYTVISNTFESINEPEEGKYISLNLTNHIVKEDTVLLCGNNAKQYAKPIVINIENTSASKCPIVSPTSDMITTTNPPQTISPTLQPTSIIVIPSSSLPSSASGFTTSQLTLSSTTASTPIAITSSSSIRSSRPTSIHDSITSIVTRPTTTDSTTLSPADADELKKELKSSKQINIYIGVAAGVLLLATTVLSMILLIIVKRGRRHSISGSNGRHDDYNEAESPGDACESST